MNTLTYPLAPDHEDRDAARVAADLRARPSSLSRSTRIGSLRRWLRHPLHPRAAATPC